MFSFVVYTTPCTISACCKVLKAQIYYILLGFLTVPVCFRHFYLCSRELRTAKQIPEGEIVENCKCTLRTRRHFFADQVDKSILQLFSKRLNRMHGNVFLKILNFRRNINNKDITFRRLHVVFFKCKLYIYIQD